VNLNNLVDSVKNIFLNKQSYKPFAKITDNNKLTNKSTQQVSNPEIINSNKTRHEYIEKGDMFNPMLGFLQRDTKCSWIPKQKKFDNINVATVSDVDLILARFKKPKHKRISEKLIIKTTKHTVGNIANIVGIKPKRSLRTIQNNCVLNGRLQKKTSWSRVFKQNTDKISVSGVNLLKSC
jgi:hypothetical protein